jgi:hypothetical protein
VLTPEKKICETLAFFFISITRRRRGRRSSRCRRRRRVRRGNVRRRVIMSILENERGFSFDFMQLNSRNETLNALQMVENEEFVAK